MMHLKCLSWGLEMYIWWFVRSKWRQLGSMKSTDLVRAGIKLQPCYLCCSHQHTQTLNCNFLVCTEENCFMELLEDSMSYCLYSGWQVDIHYLECKDPTEFLPAASQGWAWGSWPCYTEVPRKWLVLTARSLPLFGGTPTSVLQPLTSFSRTEHLPSTHFLLPPIL